MGNLGTNYVLLGIVMATILGVYAITTSAPTSLTATNYESMPFLLGHVTMVVTDSDGNIKAYQQTDNIITNQGLQCAMNVLFNVTTTCSSTGDFSVIALSSNGTAPDNSLDRFDVQAEWIGEEVARTAGSNTISQTGSTVTIAEVFTVGDSSGLTAGETVARTGLFDALGPTPDATDMIASAALSSTTVTTGDSITVTWTITSSGT